MNVINKYCSNEHIKKFVDSISSREATDLYETLWGNKEESACFEVEKGENGNIYITNVAGIIFAIVGSKLNILKNCLEDKA